MIVYFMLDFLSFVFPISIMFDSFQRNHMLLYKPHALVQEYEAWILLATTVQCDINTAAATCCFTTTNPNLNYIKSITRDMFATVARSNRREKDGRHCARHQAAADS